jgi:5-methylcytosine-specific restriction endonuclease McrA
LKLGSKDKKQNGRERHSIIEDIESIFRETRKASQIEAKSSGKIKARDVKIEVNGHLVRIATLRLQTFASRGYACCICGVRGSFFALERVNAKESYHLNFYAVDRAGEECLMTRDHIQPRALGGQDNLSNSRTMCLLCNNKLGEETVRQLDAMKKAPE